MPDYLVSDTNKEDEKGTNISDENFCVEESDIEEQASNEGYGFLTCIRASKAKHNTDSYCVS